jgi:Predicted transcriptional regulator
MSRDFGNEIDEIKKNIKEMYEMMRDNIDMKKINRNVSDTVNEIMKGFNFKHDFRYEADSANETTEENAEQAEKTEENFRSYNPNKIFEYMDNSEVVKRLQEGLIQLRKNDNVSGYITYFGDFEASGRESKWTANNVSTDELLTLIEDKSAVKVLNCIGNSLRLDILLAILKQPMTVAQLVEHFGSNSTGQIYHHLGPLMTADLIVEDENTKGVYIVQPHRVQGILMMLAGIQDMIDTKYSEGKWTPDL